jgi:pentatricopeptide repeat protein
MELERSEIVRRIEELGQKLGQSEARGPGEEVTRRARKRIFQAIGKLKKRLDHLNSASSKCEDQHSQSTSDNECNGPIKRQKLFANLNAELKTCDDVADPAPRKLLKARLKLLNDELSSLARSKQAKKAEKRIDWGIRKGIPVDVHSYTNLMNAHVRCGNVTRAKEIIVLMRDRGIHPNTVTLTTLVKGLCEQGLVKEAIAMIEEAPSGMSPNVRTVSTVLRGCLRTGDATSGLSIYESMLSKWSLRPDKSCVEYLVAMLCQSLRILEAENIVASCILIGNSSAENAQKFITPQREYDPLSNAVVFLSLARACAVLAERERASSYCECATKALAELLQMSKKKEVRSVYDSQLKLLIIIFSIQAQGLDELAATGAGGAKRSAGAAEASAQMFEEHSREAAAMDVDSIRAYLSRLKLADNQLDTINAFSRLLHFKKGNIIRFTSKGICTDLPNLWTPQTIQVVMTFWKI